MEKRKAESMVYAAQGLDLDKIIKKEGLNLDLMEQLTLDHIQRMETLKEKTLRAKSQVTKLQMELLSGNQILKPRGTEETVDLKAEVVNELSEKEEDSPVKLDTSPGTATFSHQLNSMKLDTEKIEIKVK